MAKEELQTSDEQQESLDKDQERFESLMKRVKGLEEANELLLKVADKKALSQYYQRNQEDLPKNVNLREIDGKVILGWRMSKDEVYYDSGSRSWIEVQDLTVLFEDGTKQDMSLVDFTRKYKLIPCERVGIMTDEKTKQEAFQLRRKDNGKDYTVGAQYVN